VTERADSVTARYAEHINPAFIRLLGTFGYGRVFERTRGTELWDDRGRRYLDFLAGFGATSIGHNHPRLVARLAQALSADLPHVMHVGPQALAAELGAALARVTPGLPMCLLSLSGGEAVEAAMKLARAATGRPGILHCEGGFHGTGFGSLSIMGHHRFQKPFGPLLPDCAPVAFGDLEALDRALGKRSVAAFVVEPIQGEAGVRIAEDEYLVEAQRLCRRAGALFILDEVQTGFGRTGRMCAYHRVAGLDPDAVILGKALGGSMIPVSATMTRRHLHQRAFGSAKTFDLHGSTYAGNALSCAAALETLQIIEDDKLAERAQTEGDYLCSSLAYRLSGHPLVREVRGRGLLIGLELGPTGQGVLQRLAPSLVKTVSREVLGQWLSLRLLERGILCQPASQAWDVLKITPPLNVTRADIDTFIACLVRVLDDYRDLRALVVDVSLRMGAQYKTQWAFR
jgi:putrescine aminotransferase